MSANSQQRQSRERAEKQPHLWKHPNGFYYLKWSNRRASTRTKDLQTAKGKLKGYMVCAENANTTTPAVSKMEIVHHPHKPCLWKHTQNGIWYILYKNTDGKRTRKTTGTSEASEAKAIFDRYLTALSKPIQPTDMTIGAILHGYLTDHSPNVASPESLRYSVTALISDMGNLYPSQLSDARLRLFANARQATGRKAGTVARDVQILRAALRWATRQSPRWLDEAPIFRMPVKATPPKDRWLTRAEADKLLNACQSHHIRLFILLALHTTKRTGAILGLKWTDIKDGMMCFGGGVGNKGRGDVPINATLANALEEAKELATTDWVIEYGGGRVLSIKNGFKLTCERANLKDVTPHTLRHTAATWMAMAGVPMEQIARVLGNSIAVCEKVYAKYHPEYLRSAVEAIETA